MAAVSSGYAADEAYVMQILQWRQQNDKELRSDVLPLVGRFKLEEGSSLVGSDPASVVILPPRAPKRAGTITRQGREFHFQANIPVSVKEKPSLRLSFGDFVVDVQPTGEAFSAGVAGAQSPFLQDFKGCTWFPVDPAYRREATFRPYDQPKTVSVALSLGG